MEQSREQQMMDHLVSAIQDLPADKVVQLLDFVDYLQSRYSQRRPERGSAEAILLTLERSGPLQFEPGELDALLTDIERMREMDANHYDPLPA